MYSRVLQTFGFTIASKSMMWDPSPVEINQMATVISMFVEELQIEVECLGCCYPLCYKATMREDKSR